MILKPNMQNNFRAGTLLLIALFFAVIASADDDFPDNGTYKEIAVSSFGDCRVLCRLDSKCRGVRAEQPDTREPLIYCHLNDGFGANPLFPSIPPQPLNISVALSDFNAYRASKGLKPVVLNEKLSNASKMHAQDLAEHGIISHTGTDGSGHGERLQRQGYNFSIAAENVASGQKSWEKVFKAWQDSPGHDENLLRPDVTDFGLALIYEPKTAYQTYWAMIVAAPLEVKTYRLY